MSKQFPTSKTILSAKTKAKAYFIQKQKNILSKKNKRKKSIQKPKKIFFSKSKNKNV